MVRPEERRRAGLRPSPMRARQGRQSSSAGTPYPDYCLGVRV
jgi:hypothetical protein